MTKSLTVMDLEPLRGQGAALDRGLPTGARLPSQSQSPSQPMKTQDQQPCTLGQSSDEGGAAAAPLSSPSPGTLKRRAEGPAPQGSRAALAAVSWLRRAAAAPGRAGVPSLDTGTVLLRIRYSFLARVQA